MRYGETVAKRVQIMIKWFLSLEMIDQITWLVLALISSAIWAFIIILAIAVVQKV